MIPILLLILGFALAPTSTTADAEPWYTCGVTGNYTANSTYQKNMELLSATLPKNASTRVFKDGDDGTSTTRFAKGSAGAVPNTVYGLALCSDLNATACRACITTAFRDAGNLCALSKEIIFYDKCLLRFSDQDFLDDMDYKTNPNASAVAVDGALILMNITTDPMFPGWGHDYNQNLQIFDHVMGMLNDTINQLSPQVNHHVVYGYVKTGGSPSIPPVYSLVQCTPDMAPDLCYNCLKNFSDRAMAHFSGRQRGQVLGVWCSLRYDTTKFYSSNATRRSGAPPSPSPPVVLKQKPKITKGQENKAEINVQEDESLIWGLQGRSSEFTIYDISQVSEATDNFSKENKLGQGGFGPVYKGRFPDGVEIAVKRLIASRSGQGFKEFKNEIRLIAKLQHTNLLILTTKDEIRKHLIDWNKRSAIIFGIAQGLLYLHKHSRLRVIHRDLKASNILLDCEMNPKISDFGLAKAFSSNDTEGNTRRIVGTYGYMAPEYASEGLFSIKSDVYSFGVLILEIVSGKKPSTFHRYGDFINLLGHAWQLWKDEKWLQLVDTSLVTECHTLEIMRCINIALLCVQENAADRPTMSDVVAMLSSETMALSDPKHPAYFNVRVTREEASTAIEPCSFNDVTISCIDAR
ncbi:hypothetical protein U9M48_001886 [Paspalum notatum var. saurae]|uniref:Cysteine-rich receptor-like protein kinase n=1 Tax=Paspalum notatum var. saurae TaxID=547442 RepID=A0AAQ3PMU5_PASNO